jgi:hypothetical protein
MVERCEDLVEVDGISSEDPFPLRGRNTGWGVASDSDEELGFGEVAVIDSQKPMGFLAIGMVRSRGGVGRLGIPWHL